jgi:8-oxo-dGTP diphosphatase
VSKDGRHSGAVAAVVFDERGSVLLMKRRDHGNWEPPGGS